MILPWHKHDSFRSYTIKSIIASIINNKLINTLSQLPLPIIHKAASIRIQLILISTSCMSLPAYQFLFTFEFNIFPF